MTTSTEMVSMLRAHYGGTPSKPQPGYFAPEIQAPESARRADALWLPLHGAQRGQIHGHEIKVSRSDVMVELADPMKAEAWGQFCDRWWLVVSDISLLRDLEIPDSWGIMTPPSGRSKRLMTVVRHAPPRKPNRDRDAYATVLARIYYQGDDAMTKLRFMEKQRDNADAARTRAEDRLRDATRQLRAAGVRQEQPNDQVEQRLRKLAEAMVIRWGYDRPLDYSAVLQLSEITDAEALDILFDTAAARGRIAELDRDAASRLRWIDTLLDRKELKDIRSALKGRTP